MKNEAAIKLAIEGAEAAIRALKNVQSAGVSCGRDISSSFGSAGVAITNFAASVVDAAIGFRGLDPKQMVASFYAYEKQVTKTGIAAGYTVDQLRTKYAELAKQNAVMPQSIDSFAKSVGRLTYDVRGAIDAFSGMHDMALQFNETDEEQIPFAAYLKNVKDYAGTAEDAVAKLNAQAEELGTKGGPRALRDLFVSLGGEVDRTISRMGLARDKTEAFFGVLTKGLNAQQAMRVAHAEMGFLGGNVLDISRTLGYDPLDKHGHYKEDPLSLELKLLARQRARGMSEEQIKRSYIDSNRAEGGSELYYALTEGRFRQAAKLLGLKGSDAARAAASVYKNSRSGKADQKDVAYFMAGQDLVNPLGDYLANVNDFAAKHPLLAGVASAALQKGIGMTTPLVVKALQYTQKAGVPAISLMAGVGVAGYEDITKDAGAYEEARAQEAAEAKTAASYGMDLPTYRAFKERGGDNTSESDRQFYQNLGKPPTADEIGDAMRSKPMPVMILSTPPQRTEADKSVRARN